MEKLTPNSGVTVQHHQVQVAEGEIHVVEAGSPANPPILFLHGFPQTWREYEKIIELAHTRAHVFALDLPGVGGSKIANPPGDTKNIARIVHEAVQALGLKDLTLAGHDLGGMVVFPYLTHYGSELKRAVIMDVVIPGIDPWEKVWNNPYVWHFRFNAIPELPEKLVQGKQADYFDYFFNTIAAHPEAINREARQIYAEAYSDPVALKTGFDWYRAFPEDAKVNAEFAASERQVETPLLYLRGEKEGGSIQPYLEGFTKAGLTNIESGLIPDSGHYAPEEQPEAVWQYISRFMGLS